MKTAICIRTVQDARLYELSEPYVMANGASSTRVVLHRMELGARMYTFVRFLDEKELLIRDGVWVEKDETDSKKTLQRLGYVELLVN